MLLPRNVSFAKSPEVSLATVLASAVNHRGSTTTGQYLQFYLPLYDRIIGEVLQRECINRQYYYLALNDRSRTIIVYYCRGRTITLSMNSATAFFEITGVEPFVLLRRFFIAEEEVYYKYEQYYLLFQINEGRRTITCNYIVNMVLPRRVNCGFPYYTLPLQYFSYYTVI